MFGKKGSKILKLPPVRNCFTLVMTNKLFVIINSLKVQKILLYEMKFLVLNYNCLQNPWLGGYRPQIPLLSVLCAQLNLLNPPEQNSWVRHWWKTTWKDSSEECAIAFQNRSVYSVFPSGMTSRSKKSLSLVECTAPFRVCLTRTTLAGRGGAFWNSFRRRRIESRTVANVQTFVTQLQLEQNVRYVVHCDGMHMSHRSPLARGVRWLRMRARHNGEAEALDLSSLTTSTTIAAQEFKTGNVG